MKVRILTMGRRNDIRKRNESNLVIVENSISSDPPIVLPFIIFKVREPSDFGRRECSVVQDL